MGKKKRQRFEEGSNFKWVVWKGLAEKVRHQ